MIGIDTHLLNTTERAIQEFKNPLLRNCYTDEEFVLKYFNKSLGYRFSMSNCMYESLLQETLKHCNCLPNFVVAGGAGLNWANPSNICTGIGLGCYYKIKNDPNRLNVAKSQDGGNQTKYSFVICAY